MSLKRIPSQWNNADTLWLYGQLPQHRPIGSCEFLTSLTDGSSKQVSRWVDATKSLGISMVSGNALCSCRTKEPTGKHPSAVLQNCCTDPQILIYIKTTPTIAAPAIIGVVYLRGRTYCNQLKILGINDYKSDMSS